MVRKSIIRDSFDPLDLFDPFNPSEPFDPFNPFDPFHRFVPFGPFDSIYPFDPFDPFFPFDHLIHSTCSTHSTDSTQSLFDHKSARRETKQQQIRRGMRGREYSRAAQPYNHEQLFYRNRCYPETSTVLSGVQSCELTRTPLARGRSHLGAWSEAWQEYFVFENRAALDLQCAWRVASARKEHQFLLKQDQARVPNVHNEISHYSFGQRA